MYFTAGNGRTDPFGNLGEDMCFAMICDCVHGIKAQSVKMKFFKPVERIMNEEFAHHMTCCLVEIQRCAPWRLAVRKEAHRIARQKVSGRAKMIMDDVKEDHKAESVRAFY